jgi:hypothetical protein
MRYFELAWPIAGLFRWQEQPEAHCCRRSERARFGSSGVESARCDMAFLPRFYQADVVTICVLST